MLRGYCDDKKWDLLTIEEDDLSAAGVDEREVVAVDEGDGISSDEDLLPVSVEYKDHPGFGKF